VKIFHFTRAPGNSKINGETEVKRRSAVVFCMVSDQTVTYPSSLTGIRNIADVMVFRDGKCCFGLAFCQRSSIFSVESKASDYDLMPESLTLESVHCPLGVIFQGTGFLSNTGPTTLVGMLVFFWSLFVSD
jgi:hypothetical protein